MIRFVEHSQQGDRPVACEPAALVIAGWTGRDPVAVEHHIRELEAMGIPRPAQMPMYYRVAASTLTTAPAIQVVGTGGSGEAEYVLVAGSERLWVGVGSDHTDRKLERQSVALSKQVCQKPMAPALWPLDEVADHWDALSLTSHAWIGGERVLYQQGTVSALRAPSDLMGAYTGNGELPADTVMFCGTLPVRVDIEFADRFEFELADPVLRRSLRHAYDIIALPLVG